MSDKSSGVSFPVIGIIGTALVLGKCFGVEPVASWSWWAVTLPFWGSALAVLAFLLVVFAFILIKEAFFKW